MEEHVGIHNLSNKMSNWVVNARECMAMLWRQLQSCNHYPPLPS